VHLKFAKTTVTKSGKNASGRAAILMPAADRAVNALERAQRASHPTAARRRRCQVSVPDGNWEQRSAERATAMLLKVYRNSTHGSDIAKVPDKKTRSTPAYWSTIMVNCLRYRLPPYLYLLDTLCNPDRVRNDIERKVATPD